MFSFSLLQSQEKAAYPRTENFVEDKGGFPHSQRMLSTNLNSIWQYTVRYTTRYDNGEGRKMPASEAIRKMQIKSHWDTTSHSLQKPSSQRQKITSVILDEDTLDPIFITGEVIKCYSVQNSPAVPHADKYYHVTLSSWKHSHEKVNTWLFTY